MTKSQKNLRNFGLAGALALSVAALSGIASPATSAPSHDGLWSVVIVTERGTCDRAYRYPVRISRGNVLNAGDSFDVHDIGAVIGEQLAGERCRVQHGELENPNVR